MDTANIAIAIWFSAIWALIFVFPMWDRIQRGGYQPMSAGVKPPIIVRDMTSSVIPPSPGDGPKGPPPTTGSGVQPSRKSNTWV
jgi:hypothetical protein